MAPPGPPPTMQQEVFDGEISTNNLQEKIF